MRRMEGPRLTRYQFDLALPRATIEALRNGRILFDRIRYAADTDLEGTAQRLEALDTYGNDSRTFGEDIQAMQDLIAADRLDGDGLILLHEGRDAGYFCHHSADPTTPRTHMADYHRKLLIHSVWLHMADYLRHVFGAGRRITGNHLHHLYDLAIKDESLSGMELGTLLLRYGLDVTFPDEGSIGIGFIDPDPEDGHDRTLITAPMAGLVLGKEVGSPYPEDDDEERVVPAFYSHNMRPRFERPLRYHLSEPPEALLDELRSTVDKDQESVVAYDRDSQKFAAAKLRD